MRKVLLSVIIIGALQSCNSDQGGTVNDGAQNIDSSAGREDTNHFKANPAIDSSKMKDRVDLQQRDTFKH